jgi:hypothetical protein
VSLKLLTIFEILDFGLHTRVGYGHDTHESIAVLLQVCFLFVLVKAGANGGVEVGYTLSLSCVGD